jgi:hypothetical protein
MKLKEALRVQIHAKMAEKLRNKCIHQCHCACSSDIGTCIINDAGRRAAQKNNENTRFFVEFPQTTIYTHVLKVYINFQYKNKNFQNNYQTYRHYSFKF